MKITIRQHDASAPQAGSWSQTGDWLAELGDDDDTKPPGDGHAEPDGTDDPRPEALAQADAPEAVTSAAVMTPAQETGPEQLVTSRDLAPAEPSAAAAPRSLRRPLEVAQCSLCGIALPLALLVPDGGQACADIRWYCKDAVSCTARWTTARLQEHAHMPAAPDYAPPGAGDVAHDGTSAERRGSKFQAARSAV